MSRLIRPIEGKKTTTQIIKEQYEGVCSAVNSAWTVLQHMFAGIGLLFIAALIVYSIHYPDVVKKAILYPEAIQAADFTVTLQAEIKEASMK